MSERNRFVLVLVVVLIGCIVMVWALVDIRSQERESSPLQQVVPVLPEVTKLQPPSTAEGNIYPIDSVLKRGGGWIRTPGKEDKTYILVYPAVGANPEIIGQCLQQLASAETLQLPFDFSVSKQKTNGVEFYELIWGKQDIER